MLRSQKVTLTTLLFLLIASGSLFTATPAHAAPALSRLPYDAYAAGPYKTLGNQILDATNQPYYFHGVARDGLEFSCNDNYLTPQYLALLGPQIQGLSGTFWYGNTVRLPVSEVLWLYNHSQNGEACTPAHYQSLIKRTIDTLTLFHLNVILDLQWSDAGGNGPAASWALPDADSITFWEQAAKIYARYSNVLFELYNEPHIWVPSMTNLWNCWRSGCSVSSDTSYQSICNCRETFSYQGVGTQTLVDTVRQAGANNLVLVGGANWGYDLSGIAGAPLVGTNIVYDTHPYPYAGKNTLTNWDNAFGNLSNSYPVISTESGEYDCQSTFLSQLIPYFDAHHISWLAWAWFSGGDTCGYPELIRDYNGTPTSVMGIYIYQTLLGYAGVTPQKASNPSNPGSGPVSQQWYFPGEPLGGGFSQELILDDASMQSCNVTIQYVLRTSQSQASLKTVSLKIGALGRIVAQVDKDVGIEIAAPAIQAAEIVSASGSQCAGIVAERAVHVNIPGLVKNGSATPGLTKTSTTFSFADVSAGDLIDTAFGVLNPGKVQATVTVSYFAAGRQVGQQHVTVPTLDTDSFRPLAGLPAHTQALITADQPIVAEHSTLVKNLNAGRVGMVSGFAEIMGEPQTAGDWYFAEGSTGPGFQENLVIANFTTTSAHLAITLDYANGKSDTFSLSVGPRSQVIWNVDANAGKSAHATSNLALEVHASASVAVERIVFFRYSLNGTQFTGFTEGTGIAKTAASAACTFADGYVSSGFDTWLTLQNVSGKQELITITLVHSGQPFSYQISLPVGDRGTISLNRLLPLLGQSVDNQAGYEVSMTVDSDGGAFVAERAMYWETLDTQGGSDVPGYAGN
jgi:endoglucanase